MDTKFEALPPLKRLRLMQQREEQQNQESTLCLPAKKRKLSRSQYESDATPMVRATNLTTTYCLPTKKRVCALQPDLVSDMPSLKLDLNIEWKPSFNEETETKEESKKVPLVKSDIENKHIEDNEAVVEPEEVVVDDDDDDGIVCAICQSTDGDSTDPIVLCDGCDLMVHATCYGNPLVKNIPEGDWFCAQCLASKQKSSLTENQSQRFSCCLCPVEGGAMKPTNDGLWAHVVCAVFVPEVFFEDSEGREGIDCSKVPKTRKETKCYVCKSKRGCATECSEPKCPLWFHVTCGLKEDLCIEYKQGKKGAVVAGFCKDHTELWKKQQQTGKFKIVAREEHKK